MADPADVVSADLGDLLLAVHHRLDELDVPHAFGGAIALAYHVRRPRGTVDLDVNLSVAPDAAGPVLAGLGDVAPSGDADLRALRDEGWVRLWMTGDVPLDLFVPQHEFHTSLQAGVRWVPFRGIDIPVVSATHLTVLKAMFDRPKDWVDIGDMVTAGTVDTAEAQRWLAEILGPDHHSTRRLGELAGDSRA